MFSKNMFFIHIHLHAIFQCIELFVFNKKIPLKLYLCSAWVMWWERYSLVQSEVLLCVSLCVYVCSCSKCTFWFNWMLKAKLIRSENACWAQVIVCEKYDSFISRPNLCQHSFLQLSADETKLKMMQEVSENFEVNVIIHSGFAFFGHCYMAI